MAQHFNMPTDEEVKEVSKPVYGIQPLLEKLSEIGLVIRQTVCLYCSQHFYELIQKDEKELRPAEKKETSQCRG